MSRGRAVVAIDGDVRRRGRSGTIGTGGVRMPLPARHPAPRGGIAGAIFVVPAWTALFAIRALAGRRRRHRGGHGQNQAHGFVQGAGYGRAAVENVGSSTPPWAREARVARRARRKRERRRRPDSAPSGVRLGAAMGVCLANLAFKTNGTVPAPARASPRRARAPRAMPPPRRRISKPATRRRTCSARRSRTPPRRRSRRRRANEVCSVSRRNRVSRSERGGGREEERRRRRRVVDGSSATSTSANATSAIERTSGGWFSGPPAPSGRSPRRSR